ncbi:hypothetical protein N7520_000947 [Penicillium odoratum]|uniref:uncharacterized protein n=1 Tax=Penicillium odoratum TaxID=1167516 RepID=UPI002547A9B8|nr:uncharacterized protein N7520_000947 [Penicillium odoratum]KAJ5777701.1 hypothetical protein N7520_000947 [Penicillium odoratum]
MAPPVAKQKKVTGMFIRLNENTAQVDVIDDSNEMLWYCKKKTKDMDLRDNLMKRSHEGDAR